MRTSTADGPAGRRRNSEATLESVRQSLLLGALWDSALQWPPDVFAFCESVLDASEAYRFVVSPPEGANAFRLASSELTRTVAASWRTWLDEEVPVPTELQRWWSTVDQGMEVTLSALGDGLDWPLCRALLALHAAADEACAGLGIATSAAPGSGRCFRAMARELLVETGSLSRVPTQVLHVIPRCRTGRGGISVRSLAGHVAVTSPRVAVDWHRVLARPAHVSATDARANVLLLPWPLRIEPDDFQIAPFSLENMDPSSHGFFEYAPSGRTDMQLVDGLLEVAEAESGTVDIVVLPEAALLPEEVAPLESLLARHGVWCLITGLRTGAGDGLGTNRVHIGIRQEMVWRHIVQDKHHRWQLDPHQLEQYGLSSCLDPGRHWWEAISIGRRSLQVIDLGGGVTLAPLVCEDLARAEPVGDVVRAIAPSFVVTLLLDGPQLASRWTARYAGVLADDPGCAVCTLSAYGMVRRCRPPGCTPSNIVALWKDTTGQVTEIPLDAGAEGIVLTCRVTFTRTTTADGRHDNAVEFSLLDHVSIRSCRDRRWSAPERSDDELRTVVPDIAERELSKATAWAEVVAEAALVSPEALTEVLREAIDSRLRATLDLPDPSRRFCDSVAALERELLGRGGSPLDLLEAATRLGRQPDDALALTAMLVQLATEQRLVTELRTGRLELPGDLRLDA
jgi:hypothetical protein